MGWSRVGLWLFGLSLACSAWSCQRSAGGAAASRPASTANSGTAFSEAEQRRTRLGTHAGAKPVPLLANSAAASSAAPAPAAPQPWLDFGRADTALDNDFTVGPPESPPDCHERLKVEQVRFKPAVLPVQKTRDGNICGTEQAVVYLGSQHGVRYSPAPIVTCGMALALARFDEVVQLQASENLGSRVQSVRQLGTYSCRKMARFPSWISEHSYANAIDIQSFVLESWRTVKVTSYKRNEASSEARFLRGVARALFDDGVFSVVLTPAYDRLHHDHFHLDLARYRVDGT